MYARGGRTRKVFFKLLLLLLLLLIIMNAYTHSVHGLDSDICICHSAVPLSPISPLSFLVLDLVTKLNSTFRQSTLNYNPLHTPVKQPNWPIHILLLLPLDTAQCNYGIKCMTSSYMINFDWLPYQLYCNSKRK